MGRRSIHTPAELRELILQVATTIIEEEGLSAVSARQIARRIGYSAGTLYNVFEDLDDLLSTIEQRMLERLIERLEQVPPQTDTVQHVCDLAAAYLAFTQEKPRLWNLLLEHHVPTTAITTSSAFQTRAAILMQVVENAVAPLITPGDTCKRSRVARVLWASVHGITSLATAEKISHVTAANAAEMVDDLVRNYLSGLRHAHAR